MPALRLPSKAPREAVGTVAPSQGGGPGAEQSTAGASSTRAGVLTAILAVLAVAGILMSLVVLLQPRSGPAALPVNLPGAAPAPTRGRLAPDFTLPTLSGSPITLSALRGQPIIVNFWATWCPPCRTEMPDLQAVWREHRAEGAVIIGVDLGEAPSTVSSFITRVEVDYPIALDIDERVGASYGVGALPATYFIDRQGVVRDTYSGGMNKRIMASKLAAIL